MTSEPLLLLRWLALMSIADKGSPEDVDKAFMELSRELAQMELTVGLLAYCYAEATMHCGGRNPLLVAGRWPLGSAVGSAVMTACGSLGHAPACPSCYPCCPGGVGASALRQAHMHGQTRCCMIDCPKLMHACVISVNATGPTPARTAQHAACWA